MDFEIVAALAKDNRVIGLRGKMPWGMSLKRDLEHFKELTSVASEGFENALIMGRKTFDSLGNRMLKGRMNIVITREHQRMSGIIYASSIDDALRIAEKERTERAFVIGGGEIYTQTINDPRCTRLHLTEVEGKWEGDTYFPEYSKDFILVEESKSVIENGIVYKFCEYVRRKQAA